MLNFSQYPAASRRIFSLYYLCTYTHTCIKSMKWIQICINIAKPVFKMYLLPVTWANSILYIMIVKWKYYRYFWICAYKKRVKLHLVFYTKPSVIYLSRSIEYSFINLELRTGIMFIAQSTGSPENVYNCSLILKV